MTHGRAPRLALLGLLMTAPLLAAGGGSSPGPDDGSPRLRRAARSVAPSAAAGAVKGGCPDTIVVTADNENNAGTGVGDGDMGAGDCVFNTQANHPIEWNMAVAGPLPTTSTTLVLRAFDVDDDEIDTVTFNGTTVGTLTGANDAISTVVLDVPPGLVVAGNNLVSISVVETGQETRCVEIIEAQLLLDGGCPTTASCRFIATGAPSYPVGGTVAGTVEIDTSLASQTVRLEANLIDPSGNTQTTTSGVATITAADDAITGGLAIPGSAPVGTYTVQALVFDDGSGVLQDECSTSVAVTGLGFDAAVPTASTIGLTVLAALLGFAGLLALRRRG